MAFRLLPLLSENADTFTNQDILELLGDPINDEITLKGKVYRLSSFVGFNDDGGTQPPIIFRTVEYIIAPGNTNQFAFGFTVSPDKILCSVNGILYRYGLDKDFHISHNVLYWHGGVDLALNDQLIIRYLDFDT